MPNTIPIVGRERLAFALSARSVMSASCRARIAFASVRGMPQCMAMGQATGTAAALALTGGCAVQDIDTEQLVDELVRQGVHGLRAANRTS